MREPGNRVRVTVATGYDLVRIVLGLVRLAAAVLKGHQLATEPVAGTGLLDSRWFLIGVVEFELFFGLWLLFNIFWLNVLTGRRRRIRAQQALTLVVWSRWPVVLLMVWAMMLAALPPRTATALAPLLLFVWLGVEIVATGRMLNDFAHVTRVPMQRAILLGYGAPLGVIAVILIVLFVGVQAELGFLWHLATRS